MMLSPKEWRCGPSFRLLSLILLSTKLLAVFGAETRDGLAEGEEAATDFALAPEEIRPRESNVGITLDEFQGLLFTHVNNEVSELDDETGSINRAAGADSIWSGLVQHGWNIATSTSNDDVVVDNVGRRSNEEQSSFLVCARGGNMSGYERLQSVLNGFGVDSSATLVVSNLQEETCRFVTTAASKALSLADQVMDGLTFTIIPVFDMMKISLGTIEEVSSERWAIPSPSNNRALAIISNDTWHEENTNDWERSIMVGLAPGVGGKSNTECETIAGAIIADVKIMAEEGRRRRRQLQELPAASINLRGGSNGEQNMPSSSILSVTDAFSATSRKFGNPNRRHLFESTSDAWSSAIERGLESHHMCGSMFDDIDIRLRHGNQGFEYILNPVNTVSGDVESSASNSDCVISFIAALSTHPYIVTVESNGEVTADSNTNAQWITQTGVEDHTPFFDAGITGEGEIVSVSDSGVDLRSCWFKDEDGSGNIFNGKWDFSRRKVVSYDDTFRDNIDQVGGHGSHVAGSMVGNRMDGKAGIGQGIAPDAKLHVFDLKPGNGGMSDPGAARLFASIYNNGNGAKVHNGSWGRSGRPYSSHCQDWDGSLSGEYEDLLYVSSAGNTGGGARTVKNPADCKNTITVGCSQSFDKDLESKNDMGMDYMTSWSSRGPTYDGRTKPDIVAPGYNIYSANGNVGKDSCSTTDMAGTSMSAPILAGNAALVRQYFRDGYYPCGAKGCGESITPSGSLVKAVLVNGAQKLRGVQSVPGGSVRSISEYDNTQNMGIVKLNRSLSLQGENDINTYIVNNKEIAVGETEFIDIEINTNGRSVEEISVALVWYDPPTAAYCSNCIRNNLDLKVERTRGESVVSTFHPNGLSRADIKNTVERVRLNNVSHGETYRISVRAANFDDASQKYSLALTGSFELAATPIETSDPTKSPTATPSALPTKSPTPVPSALPTMTPSEIPTKSPTTMPTVAHSSNPSASPTKSPTATPSALPTTTPSGTPSGSPTKSPTTMPTVAHSSNPSASPTKSPTATPSALPTTPPSGSPSGSPTKLPTPMPTVAHSSNPSPSPSKSPTPVPSAVPTTSPSEIPTKSPTTMPTVAHSSNPSASPTKSPTATPSALPTMTPSGTPSGSPTKSPTSMPTVAHSSNPSASPTKLPTPMPTVAHSSNPSAPILPEIPETRTEPNNPEDQSGEPSDDLPSRLDFGTYTWTKGGETRTEPNNPEDQSGEPSDDLPSRLDFGTYNKDDKNNNKNKAEEVEEVEIKDEKNDKNKNKDDKNKNKNEKNKKDDAVWTKEGD